MHVELAGLIPRLVVVLISLGIAVVAVQLWRLPAPRFVSVVLVALAAFGVWLALRP